MVLEKIAEELAELRSDNSIILVKDAIEKGIDPKIVIKELIQGLKEVGNRFEKREYFIGDMLEAADIMKNALKIITPKLSSKIISEQKRIVIGTIQGDIHDIGKGLVSLYLTIAGFDVYDIGVDVNALTFMEKAEEVKADIIAISALMTISVPAQEEVIKYLIESGIREKYKVIVGGAPTTREWAEKIGADGWAENAVEAAQVAKRLVNIGE